MHVELLHVLLKRQHKVVFMLKFSSILGMYSTFEVAMCSHHIHVHVMTFLLITNH